MRAILFLGTSLLGTQYIPKAVEALGFRPIFLLKINDYSGDPRRALEACECYEVDVNSKEDVLAAVDRFDLRSKNIAAVTSFLDETFQNVLAIAEALGIHSVDPALFTLTDKAAVSRLIPEFSPPSFLFSLSEVDESSMCSFFASQSESHSEFFLKPAISSGAVGIVKLASDATPDEIKKIIAESSIEQAEPQHWVIQPKIEGRLHSLEGFVQKGAVVFIGFSRRTRKDLTEVANEFPVDEDLSEFVRRKCCDAVIALADRSGYQNGYFHCEFIIQDDNAYFIDGNMGRMGGAAIAQQVALAYRKDPADVIQHVIDLGVFAGANTPGFKYAGREKSRTLSIWYCLPESAKILEINFSDAKISSSHIQLVTSGKSMLPVGASDSAWVGFLTGFKDDVLSEIKMLTIHTDKGLFPAFFMYEELEVADGDYAKALAFVRK